MSENRIQKAIKELRKERDRLDTEIDSLGNTTILSTRGVCNFLGVSHPTVDKFRRYKYLPLPFGRAGRSYTYDVIEVRAWLRENALLDPERPVRDKLDHERRSVVTVAGTSSLEETA